MILRSIQVEAFRCFVRAVQVGPFSERLNVLHAPNGTGKSTLFEALQRAFFDHHTVSGKEAEQLRPWGRQLTPQVVVEFSHRHVDYRLTKRFLDHPRSVLERKENNVFQPFAQGEKADLTVREILSRNTAKHGLSKIDQWGLAQVLWAPQGELPLTTPSNDVVADVRANLNAQIMTTESVVIESKIAQRYEQFFSPKTAKLRTGREAAPLWRLTQEVQQAQERLRNAEILYQNYEQAIVRVKRLQANTGEAKDLVDHTDQALTDARIESEHYQNLLTTLKERQSEQREAHARYQLLHQRSHAFTETQTLLHSVRAEQSALREELDRTVSEAATATDEVSKARTEIARVRSLREDVERTSARLERAKRFWEVIAEKNTIESQLNLTAELQRQYNEKLLQRQKLQSPSVHDVRLLTQAEQTLAVVEGEYVATKLHIDIQSLSKEPVEIRIHGEANAHVMLGAGEEKQLQLENLSELSVGEVVKLKLRLPQMVGETSTITERFLRAQRTLSETQKRLENTFGTSDREELFARVEQDQTLEAELREISAKIQGITHGHDPSLLRQKLMEVDSQIGFFIESQPEWANHRPDIHTMREIASRAQTEVDQAERNAQEHWARAERGLSLALERKAQASARLESVHRRVVELEQKLSTYTEQKHEDERAQLTHWAMQADAAKNAIAVLEQQLGKYRDDPRSTVIALEQKLRQAKQQYLSGVEIEKTEQGRLDHMAQQGPYSQWVTAQEQVAKLSAELEREQLRMEAVKLLYNTLQQCRDEAVSSLVSPVEQQAIEILRGITGTKVSKLKLHSTFEPAYVSPEVFPDVPVGIERLSGGEQEQLYLSTRLALAYVLCQQERNLVVFDDVLTATDSERLHKALTLLDQASERMQILMITCHPERYRQLTNATFFDLASLIQSAQTKNS